MESLTGLHYQTGEVVTLEILDGWIRAVRPEPNRWDPGLPVVAPGLIDNQVNGFAGIDFSGEALTVSQVSHAVSRLWETGITSFLPTVITHTPERIVQNLSLLSEAATDGLTGLSIAGIHLEGPFLSGEEGFNGCHRKEWLAMPDAALLDRFREASGGKLLQITLAPELHGAIDLIRHCRQLGIVVAIGHTNASAPVIRAAVEAGATLSTHLGNGCANWIHRHNNPIWPQLAEEGLVPSLIADGHHLLPEELLVFARAKGKERILLTSDVTYLAGMPAGRYRFGGGDVVLTSDGLLKSADQDCLAGASLPLLKGVERMSTLPGFTLADAIRMASAQVAQAYGWHDRGELLPGMRADLVLLQVGDGKIAVRKTLVAGKVVYNSEI
ncbi:MAG: N-acetylglucosamine-6-phosphate deacetylase [Marinilabiliales bacterium]|nr:N-acetylglucosamine-6-phosphate deacetylase [Marinilabiliales bacterium]